MTNTLRVVDPHVHLWDLRTGIYPHFEKPTEGKNGSNAAIARSYLLEEYLDEGEDIVSIEGAVHIEAFPTDPVVETQTLQKVADQSPVPILIVANGDLTSLDFPALLDRHAEYSMLRGIRQVLNRHDNSDLNYVDRDLMSDPAFLGGLKTLGKRGLSFDLQLYPHQMAEAAALAQQAPETCIILNHAGMWADRDLEGWKEWKAGLRLLAGESNVVVKISGLGMLDPKWTTESIRPLVLETIEAFGVERTMFASNFPVDKLYSEFRTVWLAFAACTKDFTENERDALMRANALKYYRF